MSEQSKEKDIGATDLEKAEKINREFILNENVSASSVKDIIMGIIEINRLDKKAKDKYNYYNVVPIKIVVNTFGGSAYDGFALTSVIDTSETPVHTYCYGKAMSMGFIIFASGHWRYAHPLATFMYHQVAQTLNGKTEEIVEGVKQLNRLQSVYDKYILSVTNIPKSRLDKVKKDKTELYLFGDEAVKYGLADELLPSNRKRNNHQQQ